MVMQNFNSLGTRLREAGFDDSFFNKTLKSWKVKCSKCVALVIKGPQGPIPCHDVKCPNLRKAQNGEFKES